MLFILTSPAMVFYKPVGTVGTTDHFGHWVIILITILNVILYMYNIRNSLTELNNIYTEIYIYIYIY